MPLPEVVAIDFVQCAKQLASSPAARGVSAECDRWFPAARSARPLITRGVYAWIDRVTRDRPDLVELVRRTIGHARELAGVVVDGRRRLRDPGAWFRAVVTRRLRGACSGSGKRPS